jgi:hypothetical protein
VDSAQGQAPCLVKQFRFFSPVANLGEKAGQYAAMTKPMEKERKYQHLYTERQKIIQTWWKMLTGDK